MFHNGGLTHTNYGEYNGQIDPQAVKDHFFAILRRYLQLNGTPRLMGTIKDTVIFLHKSLDKALNKKVNDTDLSKESRVFHQNFKEAGDKWADLAQGKLSREEATQHDKEIKESLEQLVKERQYRTSFLANFPPMDIFQYPSMAMPLSSVDKGEVFSWDCCLCVFQKQPKMVGVIFQYPRAPELKATMTYHYTMSVMHENSPGQPRPILVVGIEEVVGEGYEGVPMLGMFFQNRHMTFNIYEEDMSPNYIKSKFLEMVKKYLDLQGEPQFVGTIEDIFPNASQFLNKHS